MLKIGDFSKLSRISVRMLRHYDEIGFKLAEICEILPIYDDRERLMGYLDARREELLALAEDTEQRLRLLDTARLG